MTVPKTTVKLQPKTMNTSSHEKLILPTDLHYSGKDFGTLYHCDFHVVVKPVQQMSVDDSVTDYDFNNENDVSNFCPDVGGEDGGYDDDGNGILCSSIFFIVTGAQNKSVRLWQAFSSL